MLRDRKRRRQILAAAGPWPRPASYGDVELHFSLAKALDGVAPALRDVAVCFYLQGMTQAETAAYLRVSRRTVGYRLKAFSEAGAAQPTTELDR